MEGEINAAKLCVIHLSSIIGGKRKPHASELKNPPNNAGDTFDPWVGKIPWWRKEQTTTIFLPGKLHGQRSLAGYSSWGHKESEETQTKQQHCGEVLPEVKNEGRWSGLWVLLRNRILTYGLLWVGHPLLRTAYCNSNNNSLTHLCTYKTWLSGECDKAVQN